MYHGRAGSHPPTAGDTISFTVTCRSFGIYASDDPQPTVCDVQVDGGDWIENTAVTNNGQYFADLADGEHTIIIRVRAGAALRIDEFWAI